MLTSRPPQTGRWIPRRNLVSLPVPIRQTLVLASLLCATVLSGLPAQSGEPPQKPNILFIAIDDLNDWITLLSPNAPAKTPNLARLADRGMLFTHAYCASPACNPSRTATLTGLRPTTSGVYGNRSDWRRALPKRKTIFQAFRGAGYQVSGAGKIFHHHLDGAFHDGDSFDRFQPMRPQIYPDTKRNGAPEYGSRNTDWGPWPLDIEKTIDHQTVDHCIQELANVSGQQPYFIACGIFKPHSPFFAPSSFHDDLPSADLPDRGDDDLADLPSGAVNLLKRTRWFWNGMQRLDERIPGSYQRFVESYVACAQFADYQVGRLLDAIDADPRHANTMVVLWSDHGFHLGEKDHIEKFALWEKSNHIPLIIVAPGVAEPGSRCDQPVDLTSIYPTLLELARLPEDDRCDGHSLVPLLVDPDSERASPAIMTYQRGNHAVRSNRWRYIQYADGSEELYDHMTDPNEWVNLAKRSDLKDIIRDHRRWIPTGEAKGIPDLKRPR